MKSILFCIPPTKFCYWFSFVRNLESTKSVIIMCSFSFISIFSVLNCGRQYLGYAGILHYYNLHKARSISDKYFFALDSFKKGSAFRTVNKSPPLMNGMANYNLLSHWNAYFKEINKGCLIFVKLFFFKMLLSVLIYWFYLSWTLDFWMQWK